MCPNPKSLTVRDMQIDDLDKVVKLHKHCFSASISIFSALDPKLLKLYYAQIIEEAESHASILDDSSSMEIVGMAYGTMNPGLRKRFLKQNFFAILLNILKGFFTSAAFWRSILTRIRGTNAMSLAQYDTTLAKAGVPAPKGVESLNMFIGVHKDYRGGGNARKLLEHYCDQAFKAGACRVRTAVLCNNTASIRFFNKMEWNINKISEKYISVWIDKPYENR